MKTLTACQFFSQAPACEAVSGSYMMCQELPDSGGGTFREFEIYRYQPDSGKLIIDCIDLHEFAALFTDENNSDATLILKSGQKILIPKEQITKLKEMVF